MNSETISYKKGFKYQLAKHYEVCTPLMGYEVSSQYIRLQMTGKLTIYKGYAWDGPSGPTVDTKNFMRGALVHDALYQLIREGKLPQSERYTADLILKMFCRQDGMSKLRSWIVFQGVDKFASFAANVDAKKKIITAP